MYHHYLTSRTQGKVRLIVKHCHQYLIIVLLLISCCGNQIAFEFPSNLCQFKLENTFLSFRLNCKKEISKLPKFFHLTVRVKREEQQNSSTDGLLLNDNNLTTGSWLSQEEDESCSGSLMDLPERQQEEQLQEQQQELNGNGLR
jgi:hypothetical protein